MRRAIDLAWFATIVVALMVCACEARMHVEGRPSEAPPLDRPVTIRGEAVSLQQAFSEMAKQAGVRIVAPTKMRARTFSLDMKQMPLHEALDAVCRAEGCAWTAKDPFLIVVTESQYCSASSEVGSCSVLCVQGTRAQCFERPVLRCLCAPREEGR